MDKDLISIIIPVYNVEDYVSKCLDSVIRQSYKDLEIIVVNDGSLDKSLSILKKYEKKDKRIKVIDKENGGVSSARNSGLDICRGKYITFIDSDDYVEEDYIETLYKKLKEYDVDVVFSNAIDIHEDGKRVALNRFNKDILLSGNDIIKEILDEYLVVSVCWGNLYKASMIKSVRFDMKMRISEDMKFLFGILKKNTKAVIIPETKYLYVVRNSSLVHSGFNDKWYDEIDYCYSLISKYKGTKLEEYAIKRYVRVIASCMYNFDMPKDEYKKLKALVKPYFFKCLFSRISSFKFKVLLVLVLLSWR